jgi:BRCT domain type II-containing protein
MAMYIQKHINSGVSFLVALGLYYTETLQLEAAEAVLTYAEQQDPNSLKLDEAYNKLHKYRRVLHNCLFWNKCFVITGTLKMERQEAFEIIQSFGGNVVDFPVSRMDILIVGYQEWSELNEGRPSKKIVKAAELQKRGKKVKVISAEEFYSMIYSVNKALEETG